MGHPTPTSPQGDGPKRRACDECRSRKLACTKEVDGCSRCKRDGVSCHYSPMKPMGRPRKARGSQGVQAQAHVEDVPVPLPVIVPASDSAMDLDLELAFFDMNDVSFLDLMGSNLGMNTPNQIPPRQPKHPSLQPRPPGVWQMMTAEHLSQEIDFNVPPEPQPPPMSEDFSLEQAAGIIATDLPENLSPPALSPQRSVSSSDRSPSEPKPNPPHICSCLASLYLALDSLQHLPASAVSAINTARSASKTAYNTITCPTCSNPPLDPTAMITGSDAPIQSLQNMMMLGALLPSLSNAYKTILRQVDEEAAAAAASCTRLPFDLCSFGGLWGGLAATDAICGAADGLGDRLLEPAMWRLVVRALLKIDVYGLSDCAPAWEILGRDKKGQPMWQPGLKDMIQMMEERSRTRHEEMDRLVREGKVKVDEGCEYVPLDNERGEKPTCLRIIDVAKRSLVSLDIP